tara:strand:- start:16283 stop:17320 length:1038 start_codon:yes stop_codon:yes gene_type:complete
LTNIRPKKTFLEVTHLDKIGITLKGSGSYVPQQVLSNHDLSRIVDTSDDWIKTRTGISNRRIAKSNEDVSVMGHIAASKAISMANWSPDSVDLIILATSTPSDLFGSAAIIQSKLGAKNAFAFDLTAACSGFLFGLITASQYLNSGSYKRAIIIGADQLSSYVDWTDRSSCILFGDGAGAIAIEATKERNNLYGFTMKTDGDRGCFLNLPNNNDSGRINDDIEFKKGNFSQISMNGQEVYKFAVREVPLIIENLLKKTNFTSNEIDWVVLHQANQRILDAVGERLKIAQGKVLSNLSNYGNTSAATIPLMLDESIRKQKIKKNDLIISSGFGAGLSWGAALFRWG